MATILVFQPPILEVNPKVTENEPETLPNWDPLLQLEPEDEAVWEEF